MHPPTGLYGLRLALLGRHREALTAEVVMTRAVRLGEERPSIPDCRLENEDVSGAERVLAGFRGLGRGAT